jgi:PAS domain S-box-containing protein
MSAVQDVPGHAFGRETTMGLKSRIVLPVAASALALFGLLLWAIPAGVGAAAAPRWLLAALAAGLVLILGVVAVSVERCVRRPLAALVRWCEAPPNLTPAPPPEAAAGEEFARLHRSIHALQERVGAQQAELRALGARHDRVETALRLSEERFAVALRGAHDGLWERDLEHDRVVLSPRWKGMLGFAEDEFADRLETWREHVHPQDLAPVEAAFAAHLSGATPRYECQLRLLHRDGRYRWVFSRGSAVCHANGRPYRMVGLDTDVTAIKRVEYILEQVVEGTAGTYGEDFFRSLVRHFAAALEVRCAFITECTEQPPNRVRTLAFWSAPGFVDNIEYDLPGTPCETVIKEGRTCFHPSGLARTFPVEGEFESYLGIPIFGREGMVLGHLAFLDQKEMGGEMLVDAVFRIFATRAAAELERKAILARLVAPPA